MIFLHGHNPMARSSRFYTLLFLSKLTQQVEGLTAAIPHEKPLWFKLKANRLYLE